LRNYRWRAVLRGICIVCRAAAPLKSESRLQPKVVLPDWPISFREIAAAVSAFTGKTYAQTVPNAGPRACPSTVICGATPCTADIRAAPVCASTATARTPAAGARRDA